MNILKRLIEVAKKAFVMNRKVVGLYFIIFVLDLILFL